MLEEMDKSGSLILNATAVKALSNLVPIVIGMMLAALMMMISLLFVPGRRGSFVDGEQKLKDDRNLYMEVYIITI